jgi:DNA polymerase-1
MRSLIIDTEGFLVPAAKSAEYDLEWQSGDWTRVCRHNDAIAYFQDKIAEIMEANPVAVIYLAFGDTSTYRVGIEPKYKANRKKEQKVAGWPALVEAVENLATASGWVVARLPRVEADDVLGILSSSDAVLASCDKDLLTVPGRHYRNGELIYQSQRDADLAFFTQALVGDRSDNYPGCPGIGDKTAAKLLEPCETELEMWRVVVGAYRKAGQDESQALRQARCARILRPQEYDLQRELPILWQPPVG